MLLSIDIHQKLPLGGGRCHINMTSYKYDSNPIKTQRYTFAHNSGFPGARFLSGHKVNRQCVCVCVCLREWLFTAVCHKP